MTHESIEITENASSVHVLAGTVTDTGVGVIDVNIDEYGEITDIPVFYHCQGKETTANADVFITNDRVLIVNKGNAETLSVSDLKVVGFEDGLPRLCSSYIVVDYTSGGIHRCIVWNAKENKIAEFKDTEGNPIFFPCDYADIEKFLPVSRGEDIYWGANVPSSAITTCTIIELDCPYELGTYSDSDTCFGSTTTPGRSDQIDSVARSDACTRYHYHSSNPPIDHEEYTYTDDKETILIWKNAGPEGKQANYEGFSAVVAVERHSVAVTDWDRDWWHTEDSTPPESCDSELYNSCSYSETETYNIFIPIMPTPLLELVPSISRSFTIVGSGCNPNYSAIATCVKNSKTYDYKVQANSCISANIIVNAFIIQSIEKNKENTGESTCTSSEDWTGDCGRHFGGPPDENCAQNLQEGEEILGTRVLKVAASTDYFINGTESENPFDRTENTLFSNKIKELVEDYYTEAGIGATVVSNIPFDVKIH